MKVVLHTIPPKINNVNKNKNLITGFSKCGKNYSKSHILHQNQEPNHINTKSLNQYSQNSNIRRNSAKKKFENSIAIFDDMLLSKQENIIGLFFSQEGVKINLIFTIYLRAYSSSQKTPFATISIQIFSFSKL